MNIKFTHGKAMLRQIYMYVLALCLLYNNAFSANGYKAFNTGFDNYNLLNTMAEGCSPVSSLPCNSLKVSLPYNLTFTGSVTGTLTDKNGLGTGFTTVNAFSGTRTSSDGAPTNTSVPGYERSKITVSGGQLKLVAGKGIDHQSNNNQINVLGVKTAAVKKIQLEVKVIEPVNKAESQQGGLWYGLNDKTFVKLTITGNRIELRKELNDVSSIVDANTNTDRRITGVIGNLNLKTVQLRMVIDSAAGTVEGFYSTNGGTTYTNVGIDFPTKTLSIRGMALTGGVSYACIYATYRNGKTAETYTFDDFTVKNVTPAVPDFQTVNINFRPEGTTAPAGYKADIGLSFNSTRKYGWINPDTKKPVDLKNNMRLREGAGEARQLSLVQMLANFQGQVPGTWEYALPNGQYRVTVSSGDNTFFDAINQINIEGLPAIADFTGTATDKFRVATATVKVNDGRLTVDAAGGIRSKMNYIIIRQASSVADATAPTAAARFEGTVQSANVYSAQAQVFISAADAGGSGLATLQYSINNGTYTKYKAPFIITEPGNYSLNVRAVDGNNNETITRAYSFSVIDPNAPKKLAFSKDKLSFTVLKGQKVISQSVNITSSPATSSYKLSKTEASWLTLPAVSGVLQFGPANISSNIEAGNYQALVTCKADGYESAKLLIDLHVIENLKAQTALVNFQDPVTVPPISYIRDYGQPFGNRSGRYQSASLQFGWKKSADGSPLDLTANGRNRNTPDDVLLATFMHMQANHITTSFSGIKTEGYWEMKVPNGTYDATVSVGDAEVNTAPEYHSLTVEGVNAINKFIPNGKRGTISRFKEAKVRVTVKDELLTIKADSGTNTKINFASIVPVSVSPYLFWASKNTNIILKRDTTAKNVFSAILGTSNSTAASYTLTASYGSGATGWLSFNAAPSGSQASISFDYSAAKNLALGIYKATIKATSAGFTSAVFDIQLNVVNGSKPYVVSSNPVNGATNVSLSTPSISANNLHIPMVSGVQGGVNNSTIDSNSVKLFKLVDDVFLKVKGVINGTGGGDAIGFSPSSGLEANTVYKFVITSGVKSHNKDSFAPYEATFVTAPGKIDSTNILPARFTKVSVPGTQKKKYSSLVIGPDDKFYALRLDGVIERFTVNHSDGTLSGQEFLNTLVDKYGTRSAIGLVFDPKSTASNLIAWVTHSSAGLSAAPAFDGNLSRLQGADLENEELTVTKLPRSRKDHLTNSVAFGPDGALYICQGSMSSAGEFDSDWQRDEVLLSGAVLRLDMVKLKSFTLPLNVQTTANHSLINDAPEVSAVMSDGTYNPYGSSSPLTIYASGVRNAYDLLWHSNGQLYLPTNGSGGGGVSPATVAGTRRPNGNFYNGPQIPGNMGIQPQHDWLFRVNPARPVGYYGHPNPLRGEYVLNRGVKDDTLYLPSVAADANYRPAAYDYELNNSPNGVLEYKSNTFNGVLKGKLLVCRFSGGGDIIVMQPGSMVKTTYSGNNDGIYDIVKVTSGSGNNGLVGMSGFGNPLDIVEDVRNGNLYVIEYNWNDSPNLISQITLLRAETGPAPALRVAATTSSETATVDNSQNKKYEITLSNAGGGTLDVKSIRIEGQDAGKFEIADITLPTDESTLKIDRDSLVSFRIHSTALPNQSLRAKLVVTTMDNTVREVEINNVLQTELSRIDKENDLKKEEHNLEVYPNPTFGKPVFVKLKKFNKQEPVTIYVYDMQGNIIKSESAITDADGELTTQIVTKTSNNFIIRVVYLSGFRFAKVIGVN